MKAHLFMAEMAELSKILSREYGIRVIFYGDQAFTKKDLIVLPMLSQLQELTDVQCDVMRGYVDHECFHQRFTDLEPTPPKTLLKVVDEDRKKKDPDINEKMFASIANGLEDLRIEKAGFKSYPGASKHIAATANHHFDTFVKKYPTKYDTDEKKQKMQNDAGWILQLILNQGRKDYYASRTKGFAKYFRQDQIEFANHIVSLIQAMSDGRDGTHQVKELAYIVEEVFRNNNYTPSADDGEGELPDELKQLAEQAAKANQKGQGQSNLDYDQDKIDEAIRQQEEQEKIDNDTGDGDGNDNPAGTGDDDTDANQQSDGNGNDDQTKSADGTGSPSTSGTDNADGGNSGNGDLLDSTGQGTNPVQSGTGDETDSQSKKLDPDHDANSRSRLDDPRNHQLKAGDKVRKDLSGITNDYDSPPLMRTVDNKDIERLNRKKYQELMKKVPTLDQKAKIKTKKIKSNEMKDFLNDFYLSSNFLALDTGWYVISGEFDRMHHKPTRTQLAEYRSTGKIQHGVEELTYIEQEILNLIAASDSSNYDETLTQISGVPYNMKCTIEKALLAKTNRDREYHREDGYLNTRQLVSAYNGKRSVFYKKAGRIEMDTALSLVVDLSGSMCGYKSRVAMEAIIAMCEAIDKTGVIYEVVGFNVAGEPIRKQGQPALVPDGAGQSTVYHRDCAVDIYLLKEFQDKLPDCRGAIAAIPDITGGYNVDADSILYAYTRLMKREEKKKCMIVFSDGQPCEGASHKVNPRGVRNQDVILKDFCEDIEKSGVKLFGVGITSDAVRKFYTKNSVIDNVEELVTRALDNMYQALVGE